jgi:hypothetical protein
MKRLFSTWFVIRARTLSSEIPSEQKWTPENALRLALVCFLYTILLFLATLIICTGIFTA